MDSLQFCYWVQGFFEMTDSKNLTEAQVAMIKEHLQLVFNKVTQPLPTAYIPTVWTQGVGTTSIADLGLNKTRAYCSSQDSNITLRLTGCPPPEDMSKYQGWYYDGSGWTKDNLKYPFGTVSNDSQDKYKFEYKGGYPLLSC